MDPSPIPEPLRERLASLRRQSGQWFRVMAWPDPADAVRALLMLERHPDAAGFEWEVEGAELSGRWVGLEAK